MRLFSNVWSENTALFERLMELHSNSPKLYYGFKIHQYYTMAVRLETECRFSAYLLNKMPVISCDELCLCMTAVWKRISWMNLMASTWWHRSSIQVGYIFFFVRTRDEGSCSCYIVCYITLHHGYTTAMEWASPIHKNLPISWGI